MENPVVELYMEIFRESINLIGELANMAIIKTCEEIGKGNELPDKIAKLVKEHKNDVKMKDDSYIDNLIKFRSDLVEKNIDSKFLLDCFFTANKNTGLKEIWNTIPDSKKHKIVKACFADIDKEKTARDRAVKQAKRLEKTKKTKDYER